MSRAIHVIESFVKGLPGKEDAVGANGTGLNASVIAFRSECGDAIAASLLVHVVPGVR